MKLPTKQNKETFDLKHEMFRVLHCLFDVCLCKVIFQQFLYRLCQKK